MATATETKVIIDGTGTYELINGEPCVVLATAHGYWIVFILSQPLYVWRYVGDGFHCHCDMPRIVKKISDRIDL